MFDRNRTNQWGRALVVAFSITVFCVMFTNTASAQLTNKKTSVTFSGPVEVPGSRPQVLPAGSYTFKIVDSKSDRNIVQILNKDETRVYTTILAIPNYRLQATDKTIITFAERAAGSPQAIRAWFYPGERWGQEFVYPKVKATQLAKDTNLPVPYYLDAVQPSTAAPAAAVTPQELAVLEQAPLREVEPSGKDVAVSEVIQAPPVQSAALTPEGPIRNATLPRTASNTPMLALIGLLFLGIGASIRGLCAR